jgi:gas vesicle protein
MANADIALVKQKLADFKLASTELNKYFVAVKGGTLVKSDAEKIELAIQRRDAADKALAEAISETMKNVDQNNERDAQELEKVFDEIQNLNKKVADDQLRYIESQAIARAAAAAKQK